MSKRNKIRVALGSLLTLVIVAACVTVYQSGNDGTPNEKELVQKEEFTDETEVREEKKNEEAEEGKEDVQEETQNVNTSQVEGTRITEENPEVQEEVPEEAESQEIEETIADQPLAAAQPEINFTESSLMQAIPRWKASIFRGMNLALAPANISWIISSMVSGLRTLVAAT